jgi:hypothetical protein
MRPSFPTIKAENEGYQVGGFQDKTAQAKKVIVDTPVEDMPTDNTMRPFVAPITIKVKEEAVEIQYLAPLSLSYNFTVAQVTVKGSTRNVSLVTFSLRFN